MGRGQLSQLGLPRDRWQVPSSRAPQKAVCSLREATAWPTVATGQTALPEQTCQPLWHKDILFLRWKRAWRHVSGPLFQTLVQQCYPGRVSQTTAAGLHRKDCTLGSPATIQKALRGAEGRARQMGNPHTGAQARLPRPARGTGGGIRQIQGLRGKEKVRPQRLRVQSSSGQK